jgi:pimeloyl-ACP methyl ester carboxylesterase
MSVPQGSKMTTAPIVLVPGFWLGAWAWDEVAASLRADGHDVTAVTLPGLKVGRRRPIRDQHVGPHRRHLRGGQGITKRFTARHTEGKSNGSEHRRVHVQNMRESLTKFAPT